MERERGLLEALDICLTGKCSVYRAQVEKKRIIWTTIGALKQMKAEMVIRTRAMAVQAVNIASMEAGRAIISSSPSEAALWKW
jgi:hypothetical protein